MMSFWKEALKVSGPIAIVGFLLWIIITNFFSKEILSLFSSEQIFILLVILTCGLLIILFASIITYRNKKNKEKKVEPRSKAVFKKSTIKGDVVLGNKHKNKRDEK